ncbi:hypothetical protein, partial [Haladaptatus sp. R4]|uniref:hypothetical protein n=1 Tax=Haladaptatus sp. R4 TaxID=1679489 RepID=UPI00123721B4
MSAVTTATTTSKAPARSRSLHGIFVLSAPPARILARADDYDKRERAAPFSPTPTAPRQPHPPQPIPPGELRSPVLSSLRSRELRSSLTLLGRHPSHDSDEAVRRPLA